MCKVCDLHHGYILVLIFIMFEEKVKVDILVTVLIGRSSHDSTIMDDVVVVVVIESYHESIA